MPEKMPEPLKLMSLFKLSGLRSTGFGSNLSKRGEVYSCEQIIVRRARLATGLSQEVFAAALDISLKSIRDWEQGRVKPSPIVLKLFRFVANNPACIKELDAL